MNLLPKPFAMSHQIHTYAELRQQIHDDLRIKYPEWVEPNGESSMCLMESLDTLTRRGIRRTGADRQMRKDTERVLRVLLALALALLAITAFALARAQQRIRLNEIANGTHETVSVAAMRVNNPDRSPVEINR